MHVGNRIRQILEVRRIGQNELAKLSGFSEPRISELIKQESCQTSSLEKICKGLDITMSDFFAEDVPEEQRGPLMDIVKEIGLDYLAVTKRIKDDDISVEELKSAVAQLKEIGYFKK